MIGELLSLVTPRGKRALFLSATAFAIYGLAGTAMMGLVLVMIARIVGAEDINVTMWWIGLAVCLVVKWIISMTADFQKHLAGFDVVQQLREKMIYKLRSFSLSFYTNERLGEITTIIRKDVDAIELVVGHMWPRMAGELSVASLVALGLFLLNWRLGLLMVVLVPAALWVLYSGLKNIAPLEQACGDGMADLVARFVEYVRAIPLLKTFVEHRSFEENLKNSVSQLGSASSQTARSRAFILARWSFVLDLASGVLIIGGALLLVLGKVSFEHWLVFAVLSREFYRPLRALEEHWMNWVKVRDSYGRIRSLWNAPSITRPVSPQQAKGSAIVFEKVAFDYGSGAFTMKDLSFTIPQGALVALVGPSGSGKTTVTNLLLRFWDVTKGRITLGGVDLREMDYDDLLASITIVMQDVQLFADTLENNIRIGRRHATRHDVEQAARRARIHDFVMTLPQGYDTLIGEGGVGLSGGQKQRLSIARALLKDAPVVILDEMTSNVDPVNEALIQQALTELMQGRTVIMVAHRLKTICKADRIFVFSRGLLVEEGVHEELLHCQGLYSRLWHADEGTAFSS